MLSQVDYLVIKTLKQRGVYTKDIAAELGVHPGTVSRSLQRGRAPARKKRVSKLDPYKGEIDRLLAEGVWNGVVILRAIQALGYSGGHTILRDYLQPKWMQRASKATVRFETPPGRQLQSDWGEITTIIGGEATKVCFIVNILGYSRRFHFWCSDRAAAEHTYEGLIRSFEYFSGVPEEVLAHRVGEAVQFNPRFVDLAAHYGFVPRACQPYRARTKGKDERMVGYLKQHFFVRYRAFESWTHLNQLAEHWLREEADQRVQGTVREVVAARFEREAGKLQPLPRARYDTAYQERRRVAWDGYIEVRGNRYSVPAQLVRQMVSIRLSLEGELGVYAHDELVAHHRLQAATSGWVSLSEHQRQLWQSTLQVEQRPLQAYEAVL